MLGVMASGVRSCEQTRTADRYVLRHAKLMEGDSTICPIGTSAKPTAQDIAKFVRKPVSRLTTLLVTSVLAEQFLIEISSASGTSQSCTYGLFNFNRRIGFNVFLAVATQVGYRARSKIYLILHDSRAPAGSEELRKRAFTRLIDS